MPESLFRQPNDIYSISVENPPQPIPSELERVLDDEAWSIFSQSLRYCLEHPEDGLQFRLAYLLALIDHNTLSTITDTNELAESKIEYLNRLGNNLKADAERITHNRPLDGNWYIESLGEASVLSPKLMRNFSVDPTILRTIQRNLTQTRRFDTILEKLRYLTFFYKTLPTEITDTTTETVGPPTRRVKLSDRDEYIYALQQQYEAAVSTDENWFDFISFYANLKIVFPGVTEHVTLTPNDRTAMLGTLERVSKACRQNPAAPLNVVDFARVASNMKIVLAQSIHITDSGIVFTAQNDKLEQNSTQLPLSRNY